MNSSRYIPKKNKINFKKNLKTGKKFKVKGIDVVIVENKNILSSKSGVIISKKISNLATVRNKYRRRLKEVFRLDFKSLKSKEIIFLANKKILDLDFNVIREELSSIKKHIAK